MDISKVADFYQRLGKHNLNELQDIYHNQVVFKDPAHEINGIDNLTRYFCSLYKNVNECKFEVLHSQQQQDKGYISWVMYLSHPKLKNGKSVVVNGTSYIEFFEGKVRFHRDYFDLGEMLYEHIAVVGSVIRMIKKNLGN